MSIGEAMILRAQPQMVANHLSAFLEKEVSRGCQTRIAARPVALEPPYRPLVGNAAFEEPAEAVFEEAPRPEEWVRLRVWVSPDQDCDWNRSELFLKQLSGLGHRVGFEISGNEKEIRTGLLVHRAHLSTITIAFRALFQESELAPDGGAPIGAMGDQPGTSVRLYDYLPPPPYSHLLTCYDELRTTSFVGLVQALAEIPAPNLGFYQCLFQPAQPENDWHHNVATLLDIEYSIKLHRTQSLGRSYLQQAPSGDLRNMARDVDTKAHNDRPFYGAAVRVGLLGPSPASAEQMESVTAFMNLFQHGGRPLLHLTDEDYARVLPLETLAWMIQRGVTFRPGFLVNSRELAGLVHVFSPEICEARRLPLPVLESLPVRDPGLSQGTRIGTCEYAGTVRPVCIPPDVRPLSTHIISSPGMGKSTVMLNMFLQDIQSGRGAMFLDIHGDAVKQALRIIPPELYDRCIFFDPGDPSWIPLWNPLALSLGSDLYRRASDMVVSMRRVFADWGDRLEHVLRNGLIGLGHLSGSTLLDLYNLVRQGSPESELHRQRILRTTVDEPVRKFWQTDFKQDYRRSDLQAPKHKLSKLVSAGTVSLMLSQPENRIDLREIIDGGRILLIDLSSLSSDLAEMLGSFFLVILLATVFTRSDTTVEERKRFSLYVDEAHRFISAGAIEDYITQTRKFGIDLCIAHQYLRQFQSDRIDALSTVGCTILGRVDKRDSQYFAKDMCGLVDPETIMRLKPYEMIVRIGAEVVRCKTLDPPVQAAGGDPRRLIEETRRKYCRSVQEIRTGLRRRSDRGHDPSRSGASSRKYWIFTEQEMSHGTF